MTLFRYQNWIRIKKQCDEKCSFFHRGAQNCDWDDIKVDEVNDVGGNALRKVDSLVQHEDDRGQGDGFGSSSGGERDIEGPPTVQGREVPPAMDKMSREVPVALKCSWFEMLPAFANELIQAELNPTQLRLRRVIVLVLGISLRVGNAVKVLRQPCHKGRK